jgi:acetyl-CoA C-acetyltransferase
MIVAERSWAEQNGLRPLARLVAYGIAAVEPGFFGIGPVPAVRQALQRAGWKTSDVQRIEINEAFAAMPLVSTKILADGDTNRWYDLLKRTNVNGGAVAIGHPVGASGLRIMMTMMYDLRRRGGGLGVAAICGGLTQGEAVLLEVAANH